MALENLRGGCLLDLPICCGIGCSTASAQRPWGSRALFAQRCHLRQSSGCSQCWGSVHSPRRDSGRAGNSQDQPQGCTHCNGNGKRPSGG